MALSFTTDFSIHPRKDFGNSASSSIPKNCEFCILSAQTRTPFLTTISDKTEVPLLKVSSDICGPINPIFFGKAKYIFSFLDLATGYSWVYTIPNSKPIRFSNSSNIDSQWSNANLVANSNSFA